MNCDDAPATEQQLTYLRHLGYESDAPLTKAEALCLIREYREHPRLHTAVATTPLLSDETRACLRLLRTAVSSASRGSGPLLDKEDAVSKRLEFWIDTCRDAREMHCHSLPVVELYRTFGCRFFSPTYEQTQEILDALDAASDSWDWEHPELFYQTLELNFPDSVRQATHALAHL